MNFLSDVKISSVLLMLLPQCGGRGTAERAISLGRGTHTSCKKLVYRFF